MDSNNSPDVTEIATTWIAYQLWSATRPRDESGRRRNLSEFREEDAEAQSHGFWAYEAVDLLVRTEPEKAWAMILRLIELSPDDYMLGLTAKPTKIRWMVPLTPRLWRISLLPLSNVRSETNSEGEGNCVCSLHGITRDKRAVLPSVPRYDPAEHATEPIGLLSHL